MKLRSSARLAAGATAALALRPPSASTAEPASSLALPPEGGHTGPAEELDKDTKTLFLNLCAEEVTKGTTEVGKLSEIARHSVWEKLQAHGINFTEKQVKSRWDYIKRVFNFYYDKVLNGNVDIKDDVAWYDLLKSRKGTSDYENLRYGPPSDLDVLHVMFGKDKAKPDVTEKSCSSSENHFVSGFVEYEAQQSMQRVEFGVLIEYLFEKFPNWQEIGSEAIGDLQVFSKASKDRFDNDPEFKERAQQGVVRLQGGEEKYREAWKKICDISRSEFDLVYKRLNVELEEKDMKEGPLQEIVKWMQNELKEVTEDREILKRQLLNAELVCQRAESKVEEQQKVIDDLKQLVDEGEQLRRKLHNEIVDMKEGPLQEIVKSLQNELKEVAEDREILKRQLLNAELACQRSESMEKEHQKEIDDLKQLVDEGEQLRRKLHNEIVELKGNMRVFVRVRPLLSEVEDTEQNHISYPKSLELNGRGLNVVDNKGRTNKFVYDKVFEPNTEQSAIFNEVSALIQSSLDGQKVCIFSYGQTGSGKTYTMIGGSSSASKGIIPRSLQRIFSIIDSLERWLYTIYVSVVEVYNAKLYDLLAPEQCENKTVDFVETLVVNEESAIALLEKVLRKRSVRPTNMNLHSSRSHFVFQLRISGTDKMSKKTTEGYLNFIDLAGSERPKKSGSEGEAFVEASAINTSLFHLSEVLSAIMNNDKHVPYLNNKFTQFLKPYLNGGPKTVMMISIAPEISSVDESICSLRLGETVKGNKIQRAESSTALLSPNGALKHQNTEMRQKHFSSSRLPIPERHRTGKKKCRIGVTGNGRDVCAPLVM